MTEMERHLQNIERLSKLEESTKYIVEDLTDIKSDIKALTADIKALSETATLGKGAIWAFMKVGGVLMFFVGALEFVVAWLGLHQTPK